MDKNQNKNVSLNKVDLKVSMKSKFEAFQFKVLSLIFEHFIYVKWLEKTYFRKVCAHKNLGKRFSKENFFTHFVIHIDCKVSLIRINDDMVCNLCKCMSQLGLEKNFCFLFFSLHPSFFALQLLKRS